MFASTLGFAIWVAWSIIDGVGVQIGAPVWNGDCAVHAETCVAELPVVVENHRADRAVTVEGFELTDPPWYHFAPVRHFNLSVQRIEPGSVFRHTLSGIGDTEWTRVVQAVVRVGSGKARRIASLPFVLANAAREAAKLACARDRGAWLTGMSGRAYCNARVPDAGRTCRDGNECTSTCLFDRYEPVGPPEGEGWMRRQKGRPVGHCSEFERGPDRCAYIPRGASSAPPVNVRSPPPGLRLD